MRCCMIAGWSTGACPWNETEHDSATKGEDDKKGTQKRTRKDEGTQC